MKQYSFLQEFSSIKKLLGNGVNRNMIKNNVLKYPRLAQKKKYLKLMSDGIKAGKFDKIQKRVALTDLIDSHVKLPFPTKIDWSKF